MVRIFGEGGGNMEEVDVEAGVEVAAGGIMYDDDITGCGIIGQSGRRRDVEGGVGSAVHPWADEIEGGDCRRCLLEK